MKPIIEFEDVCFQYETAMEESVKHITFTVNQGECLLLCGRSGCGKTTLTKLINGLIPNFYHGICSGKVMVAGKEIEETEMYELAKSVSSVFQNPKSQFFNTDPESEITFALENQAMDLEQIEQRLKTTVQDLALGSLLEKNMFGMSGGEKQRIAVASTYANNAEIVVLDEPTANLDRKATQKVREALLKMKEEGKTIIIAEHRIDWLYGLIDRVLYLEDGNILESYRASDFFEKSIEWRCKHGLRTTVQQSKQALTIHDQGAKKSVLKIENLTFGYQKQVVADHVSLTICSGKVIALVGHNGTGKTTLSRVISGLHKETSGSILLNGKKLSCRARRKLTYLVMQDVNHQLFCESVESECMSSKRKSQDHCEQQLKELDLWNVRDQHPQALSGGQKQRLAVACAMACEKQVIIFDEPTSGLDYDNMIRVSRVLRSLAKKDYIVIVITHDYELIHSVCDEVIEL